MHESPDEAARLTAELRNAALRAVCRSYDELNATLFRRRLERPLVMWRDTARRLGQWSADPRQISLSARLLFEHGWGQVVEVLKHEMAHQFVHDVLVIRDEAAHGPAFRKVCEERGIDLSAAGLAVAVRDTEQHRAFERVKKLLALAASPNPHEAEAAMAAAQRLILKHNLETAGHARENRYAFRHLGSPRARVPRAETIAAVILEEFFFVDVIFVSVWEPFEGRWGYVLEICGTQDNLELAAYVHAFLLDTAERLWLEYRNRPDVRGRSFRQSFMAGVMNGFRKKLAGDKRSQEKEGLVWVGDEALTEFIHRRYPRRRMRRTSTNHLAKPFADGHAAGSAIEMHQPLRGGAPGSPKLLGRGD